MLLPAGTNQPTCYAVHTLEQQAMVIKISNFTTELSAAALQWLAFVRRTWKSPNLNLFSQVSHAFPQFLRDRSSDVVFSALTCQLRGPKFEYRT
jgi:hypothetical protein